MRLLAILPLKALDQAKSRLAAVLEPDRRQALALAMARHVAEIVRPCVDDCFLLGPGTLPGIARIDGVGGGLNADLSHARRTLDRGASDLLVVVPADLPMLCRADVEALVTAGLAGVAIAPDRAGVGTNGLAFSSRVDFRFAFGCHSREGHEAEALRLGLRPLLVERAGLALDIDGPEDLRLWRNCLGA